MSNMSYCRFENTSLDLADCYEQWDNDENLSEYEVEAKARILRLAQKIVADYGEGEEWS